MNITWQLLCFIISLFGIYQAYNKIDNTNIDTFKEDFRKHKKKVIAFFLFAVVFSLAFDVYYYCEDQKEKREIEASRRKIDNLQNDNKHLTEQINTLSKKNDNHYKSTVEILAKYGFKVDSLNSTIVKISDKVQSEVPPTLAILETPEINRIHSDSERVLVYTLSALNADVHILDYRYMWIEFSNGAYVNDTPAVGAGRTYNYTTIIPKGANTGAMVFLDRNMGKFQEFAFAVEYIYKSKTNKRQVPLRKIYHIKKANNSVRELSSAEHYEVSLILKKYKIWQKFYDL